MVELFYNPKYMRSTARLPIFLAKRYFFICKRLHLDIEDLIQEGYLTLVEIEKTFVGRDETALYNYASKAIRIRMWKFIGANFSWLKMPTDQHQYDRIDFFLERSYQLYGEPTKVPKWRRRPDEAEESR